MCYTSALSDYIKGFKKYGRKIWLTEYACWDQNNITLAMQKNYMKGSIDYLENDTMIFRYSWFAGNRAGAYPYLSIYAPVSGQLTELGQFYATYKAYVPDTSYYTPVPERIEAEHYSAMSGISTEPVTDFDGVENVGWIDAGDWLEYNIDVPSEGNGYVYFRVACTATTSIIIKVDGQSADTLKVPNSGGWQNWKTLSLQTSLPQGKHKLTLYAPTGGFNLNWLRISDHANTVPAVNAGDDQTIYLPVDTTILYATGTDPDGDTLYYKWTKTSGPATFTISSPESATTDITGLVKGKYYFKVVVSDGTETATDQVIVNVASAVGLESDPPGTNMVFPNPVRDLLYIRNGDVYGTTELILTDPSGRLMMNKTFPEGRDLLELDISPLISGYYILRIIRASGTSVHLLLKTE
jgi:hypothetical protein